MRSALLLIAVVSLVGCSKPANHQAYSDEKVDAQLIKPPAAAADNAAAAPSSAQAAPSTLIAAPSSPLLAYSYDFAVEISASRIKRLLDLHQVLCAEAGPSVCQVTGSNVEANTRDDVSASLSMRATPTWLDDFRKRLAADAAAAHGRIIKTQVDSEDLSKNIVDSEAILRAKTTSRDRLQAALASRPGKTADLVSIEKALSDVQGDIDSTSSELTVMRRRIAMSEIKVEYQSVGVLAPSGVWSPTTDAAHGFLRTIALTVGAMITLVAVIAPWVILSAGLWWLARRLKIRFPVLPRWQRRSDPPPPPA